MFLLVLVGLLLGRVRGERWLLLLRLAEGVRCQPSLLLLLQPLLLLLLPSLLLQLLLSGQARGQR